LTFWRPTVPWSSALLPAAVIKRQSIMYTCWVYFMIFSCPFVIKWVLGECAGISGV
jgi:hypothetical protein